MTIRPIRLLGDPVLRARCHDISNPRSAAARLVADDLRDTLHDFRIRHGFGRGIAAPQIGAPIRMVYIETGEPLLLVNPEIVDVGTEDFAVWDDCFSFPGLMVHVQRAYSIGIRYQDIAGDRHELQVEGELAELLQHEIDHLDGVLAVDRATGLDPFCLKEEWNRHYAEAGRYGEPSTRSFSNSTPVT